MDVGRFSFKFGFILYMFVCLTNALEICNQYSTLYAYCDDGYYCCYNDTQCCSNFWTVGVIVGIAIGGIVFLGIVISLCAVCVFGLGKHRGSSGNVITPNTGAQIHMISTGQSQPGNGPAYPPYAPPYGASGSQSTSFGTTPSGAYPPPPPAYETSSEKA